MIPHGTPASPGHDQSKGVPPVPTSVAIAANTAKPDGYGGSRSSRVTADRRRRPGRKPIFETPRRRWMMFVGSGDGAVTSPITESSGVLISNHSGLSGLDEL
jgi:hypothetical protein